MTKRHNSRRFTTCALSVAYAIGIAYSLAPAPAKGSTDCPHDQDYVFTSVGTDSDRQSRALTPISNTVCYLNGVRGQFLGKYEDMAIVDTGEGFWVLSRGWNGSESPGVDGWASCWDKGSATVTPEVKWVQALTMVDGQVGTRGSGQLVSLGVTSSASTGFYHCFLTRISGHFQGPGETLEIVNQWENDGLMHHYIRGWYGAWGLGINGAARCVGPLPSQPDIVIARQWLDNGYERAASGGGTSPNCNTELLNTNPMGLTYITGEYDTDQDFAQVRLETYPYSGETCSLVPFSPCNYGYYIAVGVHSGSAVGVSHIPF